MNQPTKNLLSSQVKWNSYLRLGQLQCEQYLSDTWQEVLRGYIAAQNQSQITKDSRQFENLKK